MQVRRGPEVFADELRDRILSGAVPPGSMLPAERELAEDAGLSRSAVREALGTLSMEGLLYAKLGRGGGYVVQRPPREAVVRHMDLFIRGRGLQTTSLIEVRDLLEPRCATLAAGARTDEQVQKLQELTATMSELVENIPRFLDLNVEWHVSIAEASGNEILAATMSAIAPNIRAAIDIERYQSPDALRAAQQFHERILDAISKQDQKAAGGLMQRHIDAATSALFD
ncbi:FadR/GntR family transcriptional regulator [Pseudonocardia sp. KRD291]|uniref:FadR/GntR family transcriptional regulator n=1 Tax=Pseudonocardia sp. KRD291 TaxID=2792007 RepID=UPI001C4A3191|nr:FCD domain-containing protein [Pseudonocardia sp. KRD291]MBW0101011.1 FadR family transcriptional regulator [Pseudonocardia sp. KRD291]